MEKKRSIRKMEKEGSTCEALDPTTTTNHPATLSLGSATATPNPNPNATATASFTPTPTPIATATPTTTGTLRVTATATASPNANATATVSKTGKSEVREKPSKKQIERITFLQSEIQELTSEAKNYKKELKNLAKHKTQAENALRKKELEDHVLVFEKDLKSSKGLTKRNLKADKDAATMKISDLGDLSMYDNLDESYIYKLCREIDEDRKKCKEELDSLNGRLKEKENEMEKLKLSKQAAALPKSWKQVCFPETSDSSQDKDGFDEEHNSGTEQ